MLQARIKSRRSQATRSSLEGSVLSLFLSLILTLSFLYTTLTSQVATVTHGHKVSILWIVSFNFFEIYPQYNKDFILFTLRVSSSTYLGAAAGGLGEAGQVFQKKYI